MISSHVLLSYFLFLLSWFEPGTRSELVYSEPGPHTASASILHAAELLKKALEQVPDSEWWRSPVDLPTRDIILRWISAASPTESSPDHTHPDTSVSISASNSPSSPHFHVFIFFFLN